MSRKVAILQSNYIPWKGYFDLIDQVDDFVIYDTVQYTKNDWRNRNTIKTTYGRQWLTIPVRVDNHEQKIQETQVANSVWAKKHFSSLSQNYAKTPFFKAYKEELASLYSEAGTLGLLSDINRLFIEWVNAKLGITTNILTATSFQSDENDRVKRLVDICSALNADTYISGPAAKGYLDQNMFLADNIQVEWMDYGDYPVYPQLFGEFEHSVSVMDAIFNLGEDAKYSVLRRYFGES